MRSVRFALSFLSLNIAFLGSAHALQNESDIGITGGVVLPSFGARSPTAPTLATWGAGFEAEYGMTDHLYVQGSFLASTFDGVAKDQTITPSGTSQPVIGNLYFSGAYYHPEIGLKWEAYGGYNLAPYLSARLGYLWSTYRCQSLRSNDGYDLGVPIQDRADSTLTASIGGSLEYRVLNLFFAGVSARYVMPLSSGIAGSYVSIPLSARFYW